jgi:hypothetical protein
MYIPSAGSLYILWLFLVFIHSSNMDIHRKNMFYTKKARLNRVSFKQKTCLFIMFIGLRKTWLCPVICTNMFLSFGHVYYLPRGINFKTRFVFGEL